MLSELTKEAGAASNVGTFDNFTSLALGGPILFFSLHLAIVVMCPRITTKALKSKNKKGKNKAICEYFSTLSDDFVVSALR